MLFRSLTQAQIDNYLRDQGIFRSSEENSVSLPQNPELPTTKEVMDIFDIKQPYEEFIGRIKNQYPNTITLEKGTTNELELSTDKLLEIQKVFKDTADKDYKTREDFSLADMDENEYRYALENKKLIKNLMNIYSDDIPTMLDGIKTELENNLQKIDIARGDLFATPEAKQMYDIMKKTNESDKTISDAINCLKK